MSTVDTLTILKLLAKGRTPAFVAEAVSVHADTVHRVGREHGWPDESLLLASLQRLTAAAGETIPTREPAPHPVAKTPQLQMSRPVAKPAQPRPALGPAPGGTPNGAPVSPRPELTVDELVRACRRSESKRTQALGPKLAELADRITTALRNERETAEDKARRAAEREAAQAEVKRLEKALAEARAKAVAAGAPGGVRGGARECDVCGEHLKNPQALGAHKRHKHGIPGTPKTRSSSG